MNYFLVTYRLTESGASEPAMQSAPVGSKTILYK